MNDAKYIGLDVHQATISAAVLDSTGKLLMEGILEMKATTILQFIQGLRGSLRVTFEEGTCAAWLHDLVKPHVTEVLVCKPTAQARPTATDLKSVTRSKGAPIIGGGFIYAG
jgi:hypothetical protein